MMNLTDKLRVLLHYKRSHWKSNQIIHGYLTAKASKHFQNESKRRQQKNLNSNTHFNIKETLQQLIPS